MAEPIREDIQVPLDGEGRVNVDHSCVQCGYNLRTLPREGRCPECGATVLESIVGDFLQYSDPAWLAKLSRGLKIIVLTAAIGPLCLLAAGAATMPFSGTGNEKPAHTERVIMIGLTATASVAAIGVTVGLWLFSMREPRRPARTTGTRLQDYIRVFACVWMLGVLISSLFGVTSDIGNVCASIGFLSAICCCMVVLEYGKRLAIRARAQTIAAGARFLIIAFGINLMLSLYALIAWTAGGSTDGAFVSLYLASCLFAPLVMATAILLNRLRMLLMRIADEVRQPPASSPS